MVVLQKQIKYENAFTTHLNYKQAEQWLSTNRHKVNQVITSLKRDLSQKYGSPIIDTEDHLVWRSDNGNIVEINIENVLDMFSKTGNSEAYSQFGAVPCYTILVVVVQPKQSI